VSEQKMTAEERVAQYERAMFRTAAPTVDGALVGAPTRAVSRKDAIRIAEKHAAAAVAEVARERDEARAEVEKLTEACSLLQGDLRSVVDTLDRLEYPFHPEHQNRQEIGKRLHEMHGHFHNAVARADQAERERDEARRDLEQTADQRDAAIAAETRALRERDEARADLDWAHRRLDALQRAQRDMRDPERRMVCDILANGRLRAEGYGGEGER
jgi:chromosome segregation ATPase